MNIIAKYTHGSEDSIDNDVCYVVDELPVFQECKTFCDEDRNVENRNLIVIKDGIVTECYKGTPDEINNALLKTYSLHKQDYPLLVTRKVRRDIPMKLIRSIRIILSHLSHSQFRPEIKKALRSDDFKFKVDTLNKINFLNIDFSKLNKKMSAEDIKKTIAFQIGQCLGLLDSEHYELYTKNDIIEIYPILAPYLKREPADIEPLNYLKYYMNYYLTKKHLIDDIANNYDVKLEKRK